MKLAVKVSSSSADGNPQWAGRRAFLLTLILMLALLATGTASFGQSAARSGSQPDSLSASEFSRLSRELSEEGGYFRSDNFTSNETAYLYVVDKLREIGATGGAYLGVGPEQNFTYIAKIRPRIAFLLDIRRQAVIQHMMNKAIFQLSPNRVQYLSRLLSRPLPKENPPTPDMPLAELLNFFSKAPGDDAAYAANLAAIKKMIQEDFQFPLSANDQQSLEYVYKSFRQDGLEIAYRVNGSWNGYFPTYGDLIAQPDQHGKPGHFLTNNADYEFLRDMHRKNLIIPVVGDFGGKKAIASIGEYLKKNNYSVTAFYLSNVEQYLFEGDAFSNFAKNVGKLPLTERSVFIRAVAGRYPHPAQLPGHRLTTLLQPMQGFLKDFDAGLYMTYRDLVMANFALTSSSSN
jgi:hypothetical protein